MLLQWRCQVVAAFLRSRSRQTSVVPREIPNSGESGDKNPLRRFQATK